jgi:hypothetical protein
MFDGVIETHENELNNFFQLKKSIMKSKTANARSKEAKLEPLREGIK